MAIRIDHRGRAIWHCATSFFGSLWNLMSLPTNHKQFLSSRRKFDVSLAKLSHNYAEMSPRISSKERECTGRVVGDICRILCSTVNRSVCTLYWNKNISTFWINGVFYYKIKSCALVGTPYIIMLELLYHSKPSFLKTKPWFSGRWCPSGQDSGVVITEKQVVVFIFWLHLL
jgi:hypothetical protein